MGRGSCFWIGVVSVIGLGLVLYPYTDRKLKVTLQQQSPGPQYIKNQQGLWLHTRSWTVPNPKANIILLHGAFEHSGRYEHVAQYLNMEGYSVYALDQQGHGKSEGERAYFEEWNHLAEDTILFIETLVKQLPPTIPLFLMGHSNGGLLSLAVAIKAPHLPIKGLILCAPALVVDRQITSTSVEVLKYLAKLLPKLPFNRLDNTKLSHDASVERLIAEDPLHFKEVMSVNTAVGIGAAGFDVRSKLDKVSLPFLVLHGTDDVICFPEGSQELMDKAPSVDKTIKMYDGMYHEILNEIQKEKPLRDIVEWISSRL